MPLQQTLLSWDRHPRSDGFNELSHESLGPVTLGAGIVNTAISTMVLFPGLYKIRKVGVAFTSADNVTGTDKFNLVVGTGAYVQGTIAPNDNSYSSGTSLPSSATATSGAGNYVAGAGVGYPTNVATAGMAVFSADITLAPSSTTAQQVGAAPNSTYAPGWIVCATTGGYGLFVPPNYDAVYPMLLPISLRNITIAATGAIAGLVVTLYVVPVTPLASQGSGSTLAAPFVIPGQNF